MNKEFFYKNIPLKKYCEDNGINYDYVINRKCVLKRNLKLTDQEAIDHIIENYKSNFIFFEGIPLKQYCDENSINYDYIQTHLYEKVKEENISREQALKSLIENYKISRVIVFGVPLPEYCRDNNININSIYAYASNLRRESDVSKEQSYILAIEQYNQKFIYYMDMKLSEFCRQNGYNYNTIISLRYKLMKRMNYDSKTATLEAVANYKRFFENIIRRNELKTLRQNCDNEENLITYTNSKGYDYSIISKINLLGYSLYKSILLYEYILKNYSNFDKEGVIAIVSKIEDVVKSILEGKTNVDLTTIIELYNAGYDKLLMPIINSLNKIIYKSVYVNHFRDKEEMRNHIYLLVVEKLKETYFFSAEQLRAYMKRFIMGELVKYYYSTSGDLSYNENKYDKKEYLEYMTDGTSLEEEVINNITNSELGEVLKECLSTLQIGFILYRFGFQGEPSSCDEACLKLGISLNKAQEFENEVLEVLKKNPKMLQLIR